MEPRTNIIIVVGARGVGKSTVTNWLREEIPNTNLLRLTGHADTSLNGLYKSKNMYDALMTYLHSMQRGGMDMIFDGIFISELVFCNLGYRSYDFHHEYKRYIQRLAGMDYNIHIICLYVPDGIYVDRLLNRDKVQCLNLADSVDECIRQQGEYNAICNTIEMTHRSINVHYVDTTIEWKWKRCISDILGHLLRT